MQKKNTNLYTFVSNCCVASITYRQCMLIDYMHSINDVMIVHNYIISYCDYS